LALILNNNITLSDADLLSQHQVDVVGKYNKLTVYYAAAKDIDNDGTNLLILSEDPYAIELGINFLMLLIMAALLVLYIIMTCIQCCTNKSEMSRKSIWEFELREWKRNAKTRLHNILKVCPKVNFAEDKTVFMQTNCIICLSEFTEEDILIRLFKCSHIFHPNCIESWICAKINEIPKCPVCNTMLTNHKPPTGESEINLDFSIEAP